MGDHLVLADRLGPRIHLAQRIPQLPLRYGSRRVVVHRDERLSQIAEHRRVERVRVDQQRDPPQPLGPLVTPKRVHHLDAKGWAPRKRRLRCRLDHNLLEKRRDERARRGPAPPRVGLEEVVDELPRVRGGGAFLRPLISGRTQVVHGLLLRLGFERRGARKHDEGHNADAPHVALLRVGALQHLGRHRVHRADLLRHVRAGIEAATHAEVDELDLRVTALAVEEDVFHLDVAMHHVLAVAVHDGVDDLEEDPPRLSLGVLARVQVTARAELHDDVELVAGEVLVHHIRPNDVGMI
mmetsp:Transcript_1477/g.6446  ORF Transcript_1477/g.6446 Transcript_1477/m.6446 type:complete len:296 (+) Transcript_1477:530-1417(+)|eukprot:scaffold149_cov315-Pinguiococcus_pyrenoidosus.AAC.17